MIKYGNTGDSSARILFASLLYGSMPSKKDETTWTLSKMYLNGRRRRLQDKPTGVQKQMTKG